MLIKIVKCVLYALKKNKGISKNNKNLGYGVHDHIYSK